MKTCSLLVLLLSAATAGTAAGFMPTKRALVVAAAPPSWVTLRGGAADTKDDDDDDKWSFQRATPVVAALPGVVLGLDLLLNSENVSRYWEGDSDAVPTGEEKTFSVFMGIQGLFSAACLAALTLEGSDKSIKAANWLVVSGCVAEQAVAETVNRGDKFRALDSAFSNIMTGLRVVLGVAAAVNLVKLYDEEED